MCGLVVFLEFPGDTERFADLLAEKEATLVALTPHAAHDLRERGFAFVYPEDFHNWRDEQEDGIALLDELFMLCNAADAVIQGDWPEARQVDFRPFLSAYYQLHQLRGSIWMKVYPIRAVLGALAPSRVAAPLLAGDDGGGDPLSVFGRGLYGETIRLVCAAHGIPCDSRPVPAQVLQSWRHDKREPALPWTTLFPRLLHRLARVPSLLGVRRSRARLLVVQPPERLDLLKRLLQVRLWGEVRAGFAATAAPAGPAPETWWARLCDHPEVRRCFRLGEIDWFPLTATALEGFVTRIVPRLWQDCVAAERALETLRPHALFYSNVSASPEVHALARAARRRGIPVVTEPHGPYGHFVNYVCVLFDSLATSHYLVAGPGDIPYNRDYGRFPMQEVVTGSALIDASRRWQVPRRAGLRALGLDPARPTALLVIQNVSWNVEYPPYSLRDDRRSADMQLQVLEALVAHPDLQVILKGHPSRLYPQTPLAGIGKRLLGDRFAYISEWPFRRMLEMADFFVLDYAVTTIYEALVSDKPIYLLRDFYKTYPPAEEALQGCARVFDDADALVAALKADLASGAAFRPAAGRDGRFMELYGDPYGDGRAAERVARAVADIAEAAARERP